MRHRPTGFGFSVADRIGYLDPKAWESATSGASFFLSRPYLEAVEAHAPENLSPRYALAFDGDRPVAAVYAQLVEITPERLSVRALKGLEERALICGNLMTWGSHGVAFAPGAPEARLWPAVAEALYRIRRSERLSGQTDLMMLKDFPEAEKFADPALRPFRYRALETEPDMELAIPEAWKTYEDYLNGLVSKPRSSIRKMLRDVEESGLQVETVTNLEGLGPELHALYLKTHGKAKIRLVTAPLGYLPAVARAAGAGFRCTLVRDEGKIVGFGACIKDGQTAVGYHVGIDPEANAKAPVYHRLLHGMIEHAIGFGCRRLSFGRTALEAKANLGARPVPLRVLIRHRQPVMNTVVQAVLRAMPHDEAPVRDLMKK